MDMVNGYLRAVRRLSQAREGGNMKPCLPGLPRPPDDGMPLVQLF